jgi:two-component system, NarL family, nitrate/nitrite response regulator NarL
MRKTDVPGMLTAMRLLCVIVDDNLPFLRISRSMLERQGLTVVGIASTGAEALALAGALHPDIALVDISLGDESGFDVARQLGGLVGTVIMISSHAEDDYAELIASSPAVGFLSKTSLSADAIRELVVS